MGRMEILQKYNRRCPPLPRFWLKREKLQITAKRSIILLKKIGKVKDFSFIRKGPYYRDIFNQIKGYPAPPPFKNTPVAPLIVCSHLLFLISFNVRENRCLLIICNIVNNLYYCCYAETSSSAVQKRHNKVYGNPIAPTLYSSLLCLNEH